MTRQSCDLCGGTDFIPVRKSKCVPLFSCRRCGLIIRASKVTEENEIDTYSREYYSDQDIEFWIKDRARLFQKALRRIDFLQRPGRILDVGCGIGTFLKIAREGGWETYGVDPSEFGCAFARNKLNLTVFQGELKDAHFSENFFDVITLWNVLDHLWNPKETLSLCRKLLEENGMIVIRVPNIRFHLMMDRCYRIVLPILQRIGLFEHPVFHLYGFSWETLRKMCNDIGFQHIRLVPSFPSKGTSDSRSASKLRIWVNAAKSLFYFYAKLLKCVTAGRRIITPSLLVFANK